MTISDKYLFKAILPMDTYNLGYGTCVAVANSTTA